mmetsp:Transcript_109876/g.309898  ORF Transcript_109876/g.309898 Transcript_109876/m.309898 type:complete len:416 (+) Transcript_109876:44-1291(+)
MTAYADVAHEPKHRRASLPQPQDDAGAAAADGTATDAGDAKGGKDVGSGKRHRTLVGAAREKMLQMSRCVHKRRPDALAISGLLAFCTFGYAFVSEELLIPAEAAFVCIAWPACHAIFALFIATWLGVVLYGPGRPLGKSKTALHPELVAALNAGAHNRFRPFSAADTWCFECNRWKPALVHHCSICGRCCLWMDHHCQFVSQCIGFRNMRCFILFFLYGHVLVAAIFLLELRRLVLAFSTGGVPLSKWLAGELLVFTLALIYALWLSNTHLRFTLKKVFAGWRSAVLLTKFQDVAMQGLEVEQKYGMFESSGLPAPPGSQELTRANRSVVWPEGGLRGLFAGSNWLTTLEPVFGAPPSWRWLLPLPGGSGDPLCPDAFDAQACNGWASLASALDHHALVLQVQRQFADKGLSGV